MIEITKLADPLIKEFIKLKNVDKETIVISSKKALNKAIKSNINIKKIFISNEHIDDYRSFSNVYYCKKKIMQEIIGYKLHNGVFALAQKPVLFNLEQLDSKVIILNGLTSPENVGSIIRSASAFGFKSILFDHKTCSPYLQRCIRVSMGNIFFVKISKSLNLLNDLKFLKEKNYQIYSTANIENAIDINIVKPTEKYALIIGSEGHGIDQELLKFSSKILKIPVLNEVEHLNASIAASISMYSLSTIK